MDQRACAVLLPTKTDWQTSWKHLALSCFSFFKNSADLKEQLSPAPCFTTTLYFIPPVSYVFSCLQSHYRGWCPGQVMAVILLLGWTNARHIVIFFSCIHCCFSLRNFNNSITIHPTQTEELDESSEFLRDSSSNWTTEAICRKYLSFVTVTLPSSSVFLIDKIHFGLISLFLLHRETIK